MSTGTSVKERPILFSGEMVRAILDGRKTQTRRVVKDTFGLDAEYRKNSAKLLSAVFGREPTKDDEDSFLPTCPYGAPGDRLWVRETWGYKSFADAQNRLPVFKADYAGERQEKTLRWRPSIHMPRWASRITLEVVSVRVERLRAISEKDAIAEGLGHEDVDAAVADFAALWDRINGKTCPWASDPWVWVVEFRRITP